MKATNSEDFFNDPGDVTRINDLTGGDHPRQPRRRSDDGTAFLPDPYDWGAAKSDDEAVEEMAEGYLQGATTGGAEIAMEALDSVSDEEEGGPFLEEDGSLEFANDIDEMNPADAAREPLPSPMRGS